MVKMWIVGVVMLLAANGAAAESRMLAVKHWAYQLQGALPRPSAAVDCIVVDAMEEGRFLPPGRVQALKQRPGARDRIVLAYLSIGEAETYRYYWRKSWKRATPAFLAAENPEWKGNYKVRYWRPEWQAIVIEYLDRILAAGFDGAYLDVIDAFEYFGPEGKRPSQENAAAEMSRFVKRLARHARVERGAADFVIVPQNGANLLDELTAPDAREYLATVDAIGAEDTFFFGDKAEDNRLNVQKEIVAALGRFRDAGKPVLAVEYLTDPDRVRQFAKMARQHGFVPGIAVRSLDRILELRE
jgi:cysteinyl-tRNA synthetase, unknown class